MNSVRIRLFSCRLLSRRTTPSSGTSHRIFQRFGTTSVILCAPGAQEWHDPLEKQRGVHYRGAPARAHWTSSGTERSIPCLLRTDVPWTPRRRNVIYPKQARSAGNTNARTASNFRIARRTTAIRKLAKIEHCRHKVQLPKPRSQRAKRTPPRRFPRVRVQVGTSQPAPSISRREPCYELLGLCYPAESHLNEK